MATFEATGPEDIAAWLELSTRAERALRKLNVTSAEGFMDLTATEIRRLKGIGVKTVREIMEAKAYIRKISSSPLPDVLDMLPGQGAEYEDIVSAMEHLNTVLDSYDMHGKTPRPLFMLRHSDGRPVLIQDVLAHRSQPT